MVKLSLYTGLKCPNCLMDIVLRGGIIASIINSSIIAKTLEKGATLTCHNCQHTWKVAGRK